MLSRFSFITENKPAENFYTRVDTCSCHSSGIQTDFTSQKQVRIDCRLFQKKATINVFPLCSSLPQLTNRKYRDQTNTWEKERERKEVECDLPAEVRRSICVAKTALESTAGEGNLSFQDCELMKMTQAAHGRERRTETTLFMASLEANPSVASKAQTSIETQTENILELKRLVFAPLQPFSVILCEALHPSFPYCISFNKALNANS